VVYLTTVRTKVVALDGASGREIWTFDPMAERWPKFSRPVANGVHRGVSFWRGPTGVGNRILFGTPDGRLFSLHAVTGQPDPCFGTGGFVDLRAGLEPEHRSRAYGVTSAVAVFRNLVIVPPSVGEGPEPVAPGDPRAFDIRTGREVWRFHTIPRPGEPGYETWPPGAWKTHGSANPWSGFTLDEKTGTLFCATGSAAYDFYGAHRAGSNLYANCVLALDAATGRRRWHFQTTHHDVWDMDNPCPPILISIRRSGRTIPAVAQLTKTGLCWILDRATGSPLFGWEERPVSTLGVAGEKLYASQPFPLKPPPFSPQRVTEADLLDFDPVLHKEAVEQFRTLAGGTLYSPGSTGGTLITPGFHGGANWSGGAFDAVSGKLLLNTTNLPCIVRLSRAGTVTDFHQGGYPRFKVRQTYPAVKPPWGTLTAIDVSSGEFSWRRTLGYYPELREKGVADTGTESFGGVILTASGLAFIGGTKDERFRAFSTHDGALLWETQLPAGGYATPCTYMSRGRQFVLIAAGGGGKLGTKSSDAFVAFALPVER
jgi:quinoprotein glucose dehydrogenase